MRVAMTAWAMTAGRYRFKLPCRSYHAGQAKHEQPEQDLGKAYVQQRLLKAEMIMKIRGAEDHGKDDVLVYDRFWRN